MPNQYNAPMTPKKLMPRPRRERPKFPGPCIKCGAPRSQYSKTRLCYSCTRQGWKESSDSRATMIVSDWMTDEHGNLTRTVSGK